MSLTGTVAGLAAPIAEANGLVLFDVEHTGGVVKVTVDREGGVDMDAIAKVTRALSRALDELDPIEARYTLEVSSPGLERSLRTPEHFRWAVGQQVAIKATAAAAPEGERRLAGTLREADDDGVSVEPAEGAPEGIGHDGPDGLRRLRYDEIDRARTVFEWGPAPKPGKASPGKASREKRAKAS